MSQNEESTFLLELQQNSPDCITFSEDTVYYKSFDVSTYGELASAYVTLVIFLLAMAYQLRLLKQTYDCLRNANRNICYLVLVQAASLTTILIEIASLIMITSFFYEVNSNPSNYTETTLWDSNMLGFLQIYDFLQQLGVLFYIITFYLALAKWLEILKITMKMNTCWFKVYQLFTHGVFSTAFILVIIGTVFLLDNTHGKTEYNFLIIYKETAYWDVADPRCEKSFPHFFLTIFSFGNPLLFNSNYFVSIPIIVTGLFTSVFVWYLSSKIEFIYEIDYQFKRKLRIQLWFIILSSPLRCTFDLIENANAIKCFNFSGDQQQFQNKSLTWIYLLPISFIIDSCAVIPFSMLFSPSKKFRQNYKEQLSTLTEDG